ncbi:MAG: antibiotic biosynthesis monooxygenase [Novosphingobium sp.]|nr:antibiotic biosynthesis monooxygenase [Novosphingobium sp.]
MFIAMNRFQVKLGQEEAFETVWKNRDSFLEDVPGFVSFHLLRGSAEEDHTLFATHTLWESRDAFVAWTKSEAFRKAHAGAGNNKPLYAGSPRLELFDTVQSVTAS